MGIMNFLFKQISMQRNAEARHKLLLEKIKQLKNNPDHRPQTVFIKTGKRLIISKAEAADKLSLILQKTVSKEKVSAVVISARTPLNPNHKANSTVFIYSDADWNIEFAVPAGVDQGIYAFEKKYFNFIKTGSNNLPPIVLRYIEFDFLKLEYRFSTDGTDLVITGISAYASENSLIISEYNEPPSSKILKADIKKGKNILMSMHI